MKTLYLVARNHMDPSWLRCFTDHYVHPATGEIVRPYSDIEELEILEYMDFAERYGVRYHIEQSFVVKEFLKRNPDQKERFAALVRKGLLELAGGGETVIDCNMTRGESWARNHLYSREYYAREFGHSPRYAITPDIFGLPSQLPQFFRSIGYDALILFDRVMLKNKPFWQGLDGTKIVLDNRFLDPPQPTPRSADCVKLRACNVCHGEGCPVCNGTGIDPTYDMTRPDKTLDHESYYGNVSADELLDNLLKVDKDSYHVIITSEETRVGDFLYGPLVEAAKRHNVEVKFLSFEDNHDVWCRGLVDRLRAGDTPDEETDFRPEGNPCASGCFSSRIYMKKANGELESALLSAERLAVMAKLLGGWDETAVPRRDYPQQKIEALWNKMSFIQFHDCVPGEHCDASYNELRRVIREVRWGVHQIARDAQREAMRCIDTALPASLSATDGWKATVVFNADMHDMILPSLAIQVPAGTAAVELADANGNPVHAYDFKVTAERVGAGLICTAEAPVPAMGWRVLFWRPAEAAALSTTILGRGEGVIENEFFRITVKDAHVTSIYDKNNKHTAFGEDAGCIAVGYDDGSPWGRNSLEADHRKLRATEAKIETCDGCSRIILSGGYADPAKHINSLSFVQTLTLRAGEPMVRFAVALDFDGNTTRVHADFPFADKVGDTLYCEVPFGTMARGPVPHDFVLWLTDEWPSLGFAGVHTDAVKGGYNLAVLKNGLPGVKLLDNEMQMSIFRSFAPDGPTYAGTCDCGHHECEYALVSFKGAFADGNTAALAESYCVPTWNQPVENGVGVRISGNPTGDTYAGDRVLPQLFSAVPDNLILSAMKAAQDGKGIVLRFYESAGKTARLKLPAGMKLLPCDTLEVPKTGARKVGVYTFRPFEIATFRLFL